MASTSQISEINTADKPESCQTRLNDFVEESPEEGNRNVMLPDRPASKARAVKEARKRMKTKIDNIPEVLSGNRT
ncbi:hypothetical protein K449DRAFT_429694 [Hypoxylon sp. EC38]|nr:hypothetical protein K449DRAFT_429694 [Hypoxylon sp. EC38]